MVLTAGKKRHGRSRFPHKKSNSTSHFHVHTVITGNWIELIGSSSSFGSDIHALARALFSPLPMQEMSNEIPGLYVSTTGTSAQNSSSPPYLCRTPLA